MASEAIFSPASIGGAKRCFWSSVPSARIGGSAILALGKGEQRVVVKDGEPAVATVINATLSCDHRVIDGAVGARFLQALGKEIDAL